MANDENLTVPQKGEVRNPGGKQPGTRNRSTVARAILAVGALTPVEVLMSLRQVYPEMADKMTTEELLTWAQVNRARAGDTNAYKAIMDSAYGGPTQNILSDGEALKAPVIQIINPNT